MEEKPMRRIATGLVLTAALVLAPLATAATLAEWTFETSIPATAGPHAAEGGVFGGSATGYHSSASVVYSNPAGNGSAESFSSNYWSISDYYQFQTSSLGYTSIEISWDQARSSTGPGTFDLQWSTDGSTWNTLTNDYTVQISGTGGPGTWSSSPPRNAAYTFGPTAAPAALDNQTTIYFRMTNQVTPGGTAGTNRIDNVVVTGVPEPASLLLLGLGLIALRRR
jgi:hypothetical protein